MRDRVDRVSAALILAAGASTRFGSPKQIACFHGERLLERAVRVASEAGCMPVVVVLGANADSIRRECRLEGTVVLWNAAWAEGMGSSMRMGFSALRDVDGVVVMTCDMPAVTADHLRELMRSGGVTGSQYGGRNGVPAYFPRSAFGALRELTGDAGAREMLKGSASVALRGGDADIDHPEDLVRFEAWFEHSDLGQGKGKDLPGNANPRKEVKGRNSKRV